LIVNASAVTKVKGPASSRRPVPERGDLLVEVFGHA
jgi:hypothetical protein